jgi:hypothetical protein
MFRYLLHLSKHYINMEFQEKLLSMEKMLQETQQMVQALLHEKNEVLDDWISQETAERISGLKRTRLYELRRNGKVRSSTITGKKVFYRRSDFAALLEENMRKR